MPAVAMPAHKKGDYLVDYEEKVFEDVKAKPGEKALITFHTVAFEGSIGLVNILQALRLQRKGFKTTVLLYGPGVTLGVQRGFPKLGDEPFPGAEEDSAPAANSTDGTPKYRPDDPFGQTVRHRIRSHPHHQPACRTVWQPSIRCRR